MNTPAFYITVESIACNQSPEEGCFELVDISKRLGCWVKCTLNDVNLFISPEMSGYDVYSMFLARVDEQS